MTDTIGAYILRFSSAGSVYIGSTDDFHRRRTEHVGSLNKGVHHNPLVQEAFFYDRDIVFEFFPTNNRAEAYAKEQELINQYRPTGLLLNVKQTVQFRTEQTNERISSALIGHEVSVETRKRLGESKKGNKFWVGKTHREDSRKKISEANKGNDYAKGHVKTPEGIEKIRQTHLGRKHTEESKLLVSLNSPMAKQVCVNGVLYRNITEASKAIGVSNDTIRRRCLSGYEGYQFTEEQKARIKKV